MCFDVIGKKIQCFKDKTEFTDLKENKVGLCLALPLQVVSKANTSFIILGEYLFENSPCTGIFLQTLGHF